MALNFRNCAVHMLSQQDTKSSPEEEGKVGLWLYSIAACGHFQNGSQLGPIVLTCWSSAPQRKIAINTHPVLAQDAQPSPDATYRQSSLIQQKKNPESRRARGGIHWPPRSSTTAGQSHLRDLVPAAPSSWNTLNPESL